MEDSTTTNKRIAKNTIYLYVRMLLVMGVSLYTSRIILSALGFDDYGLYNVIGGFVSLFSVLSGSLSSAISRFITFELGTKNKERLCNIFSTSISIQLILCIIIITLCSTVGVWFIANKMKIPNGDYISAYCVFAFSIASFCLNLLNVPFNAAIIAHEKMSIFSYVSIVEVVLKLGVSFCIDLFSKYRLIAYASLLFIISLAIWLIYLCYCRKHFLECHTGPKFNRGLIKEMGSFAGWNFIGSSSAVLRDQGNNVILNLFFGAVVNAAYGISMQLRSAVSQLSNNFMVAVNPQITKLYASGDLTEMNKLVFRSSKLSFYLCWLVSIIILLNSSYILHLWLVDVPEYTTVLVNWTILFILSESVSSSLVTAMLATGDIRNYQIVVGSFQMLNLPLSYILLKMGYTPPITLIVAVIISQFCLSARLFMLRKMISIDSFKFLKDVYLRCVIVAIFSYIVSYIIKSNLPEMSLGIFAFESIVAFSIALLSIYFGGLKKEERRFIFQQIINFKMKFHIL